MRCTQVIIILSLFFVTSLATYTKKYYWKDYNGEIPEDSLPVTNDTQLYIGQAFVKHHGILVAPITPGIKTLTSSKEGIHKTTVYNRILCTVNKNDFKWIPARASDLHLKTFYTDLVVGGTEWDTYLYIGRIKYQNEIKIGKVCSLTVGNAKMYFVHNNNEISSDSYEILTYSPDYNSVETN